MRPFEELANAIIITAAKDYRKAVKRLKKYPKDYAARQTKNECLRFFRSSWYRDLTDVDAELLIQKLNMEVGV